MVNIISYVTVVDFIYLCLWCHMEKKPNTIKI